MCNECNDVPQLGKVLGASMAEAGIEASKSKLDELLGVQTDTLQIIDNLAGRLSPVSAPAPATDATSSDYNHITNAVERQYVINSLLRDIKNSLVI